MGPSDVALFFRMQLPMARLCLRTYQVIDCFGENIDLVVDGRKTPGGKPSTIIDVTVVPPIVLREGSVLLKL